jgi:DNA-binding GntR family transcriptional regulator
MARQHRQILRALIRRDWLRARKALSDHIRSQDAVLTKLLSVSKEKTSCPD